MKVELSASYEPGWIETVLILSSGLVASWGLFNLMGITFGVLAATSPSFSLAEAVRDGLGDARPYVLMVLVPLGVAGVLRMRWTRASRRSRKHAVH